MFKASNQKVVKVVKVACIGGALLFTILYHIWYQSGLYSPVGIQFSPVRVSVEIN